MHTYNEPIQLNTKIIYAFASKEIMYLTYNTTYNGDTTKNIHKVFTSLKLLDNDSIIYMLIDLLKIK